MGMPRAQMAAWRVAQQMRLGGAASISLRRYDTRNSDEGEPLRNPPEIRGDLVAGAAAAGSSTLVLSADTLVGYLAPADKLYLAGFQAPVTVAALAETAGNAVSVVLEEDLPAAVPAGTPVTPVFSADQPLLAKVSEGPRIVEDGKLSDVRSMVVMISAFDLSVEPEPQWTVFLPDGLEYPIVAVTPTLVEGFAATYSIQIRKRG